MGESLDFRGAQTLVIRDADAESRLSLRAAVAVWTIGAGAGWELIAWLIKAVA